MISAQTIDNAYTLIQDMKDINKYPELQYVNAIVFLSLKQKRRGKNNDYLTQEKYTELVKVCMDKNVPFGFDSCSAPSFIESVKDHPNFESYKSLTEDCESTLFSSYINEYGDFYPCSFTEGWVEGAWSSGLSVLDCKDFIKDIWFNPRTVQFRNALLGNTDSLGCRNCPAFSVCGIEMQLEMKDGQYQKVQKSNYEMNPIEITEIK